MSGPIDTGWQRRRVPLTFQISYRTLGAIHLSLTCRSASLGEQPLAPGELPPLPPAGDSGTCGYLLQSQPIAGALPILRRQGGKLVYVPRQYPRYFVDLNGEYEAYLARFSAKSRATLKRKLRKFAELSGGRIDWHSYRTPEEIAEFFCLAAPLSRKTYQERILGSGLHRGPEFEAAAARLAAEDRLRAYLLFLHDRPIAYLFCPIDNGVLIYDRLGYDPEYASASPGTVLQLLVIEALFKEGSHRLFDFTEGEGQHKEFFSTGSRTCADIFIVERRARVLAAILAHRVFSQLVAGLGDAATRLGVRARIRRLLRA